MAATACFFLAAALCFFMAGRYFMKDRWTSNT
jgi:hypothetical protein